MRNIIFVSDEGVLDFATSRASPNGRGKAIPIILWGGCGHARAFKRRPRPNSARKQLRTFWANQSRELPGLANRSKLLQLDISAPPMASTSSIKIIANRCTEHLVYS